MGLWHGQPETQSKSGPTWGEPLHTGVHKEPGRAEAGDTLELHRAGQHKEKHTQKAALQELDMLGNGIR